jgi:hypothetical protein
MYQKNNIKKLHKAHTQVKAYTITFDPYQRGKHGEGLFGNIAKHIKDLVNKHKTLLNPVIRAVKGSAHQGVHKLSKYAHSKIDNIRELEGEGLFGDVLSMINPTVGTNAKSIGLGVKHPKTKKGKGFLGDVLTMINPTVGTIAKNCWSRC